MVNIYSPPKSDTKVELDPEVQELSVLLRQQRKWISPLIAFLVTFLALIFVSFTGFSGFAFLLIIPTILAAAAVKYLGKLIEVKYRLIALGPTIVLNILSMSGNMMIALAVTSLASLSFIAVTRRPLSYDQERMLFKWRIGKLQP